MKGPRARPPLWQLPNGESGFLGSPSAVLLTGYGNLGRRARTLAGVHTHSGGSSWSRVLVAHVHAACRDPARERRN